MRSKFKYMSIDKQNLFKVSHFNKLNFNTGSFSIIPISKLSDEKLTSIHIHNGKQYKKIKQSSLKLLLNDNFFFVRKLKVGAFVFTKKQCIFKKKRKKTK